MKKLLVIALAAVFAIPMFNSCKKGENDPFLSLKSRKARLTGEWVLKSGSITQTSGSTTSVLTFTGTTVTSSDGSYPYTQTIEINKDGTYKVTEVDPNGVSTEEGTWSFGRKDKELELKNKEYIVQKVTNKTAPQYDYQTNTYKMVTSTYTGDNCPVNTFVIDQLKNKEMIIIIDGTSISGSSSYSEKGTMTFEQK